MAEVLWLHRDPMPRLDKRTAQALDLQFGLTRKELKQQAYYGMWWVIGFARGQMGFPRGWSGEWFGLRLVPGIPLGDCPVLFVGSEGANTFCASQRTLVPSLWVASLYFTAPNLWDDARTTLKVIRPGLTRLHHELHGQGDLEALWSATYSDDLRDAQRPPDGSNQHAAWCAARRDLCSFSDNSREYRERLAFMYRAAADEVAPWPLPEHLGPWREGCILRGFLDNRNNARVVERALYAWEAARIPAALDGTCAYRPFTALPDDQAARLVWIPADVLRTEAADAPSEWKCDPWWEPTMALAKAGWEQYDGKAHFEAARKLDEAGRPVDALNALISANYWMVRRKPGPRFEVMEYALDLARRNSWEHLVYNIEVVQHAARQMAGK